MRTIQKETLASISRELIDRFTGQRPAIPAVLFGSGAVAVSCPKSNTIWQALGRKDAHDIDFIIPRSAVRQIEACEVALDLVKEDNFYESRVQFHVLPYLAATSEVPVELFISPIYTSHLIHVPEKLFYLNGVLPRSWQVALKLLFSRFNPDQLADLCVLLEAIRKEGGGEMICLERVVEFFGGHYCRWKTMRARVLDLRRYVAGLANDNRELISGALELIEDLSAGVNSRWKALRRFDKGIIGAVLEASCRGYEPEEPGDFPDPWTERALGR